jgi:hypothetical protein
VPVLRQDLDINHLLVYDITNSGASAEFIVLEKLPNITIKSGETAKHYHKIQHSNLHHENNYVSGEVCNTTLTD